MKKIYSPYLMVFGLIFWGLIIWTSSFAQETDYLLANEDIFGKLRRPGVSFPHELHVDMLESESCGNCHHVLDEHRGRLVYEEGEEASCKQCHLKSKDGNIPALREAYHGNCTVCHRRLIKESTQKSGPTTCGGCHIKQPGSP